MLRTIIFFATIVALALTGTTAEAGSKYRTRSWQAPLKDCTRLNGRWGYYGNPWCTPAEQARWDRWDARRAGR